MPLSLFPCHAPSLIYGPTFFAPLLLLCRFGSAFRVSAVTCLLVAQLLVIVHHRLLVTMVAHGLQFLASSISRPSSPDSRRAQNTCTGSWGTAAPLPSLPMPPIMVLSHFLPASSSALPVFLVSEMSMPAARSVPTHRGCSHLAMRARTAHERVPVSCRVNAS